jgi:hypothetical protein
MKTTIGALAGLASAVLILAGVPGAAFAAPPDPSSTATPVPTDAARKPVPPGTTDLARAQQPDGYINVWEHAMWDTEGGLWCKWVGNHRYWGDAAGDTWEGSTPGICKSGGQSFDNVATSMYNTGFPGEFDDVRFFKHAHYVQPSMCLGNGDYWGNLALGWEVFNDFTYANDEISSHRWVDSCSF